MGPDVFGRALWDWARGGGVPEVLERDDGWTEEGAGPEGYLAPYRDWPWAERQAMRYVRGRVIDVGCGAGRVALHLQARRFDVVGLDASPLAVRAAKLRGVETAWCMSVDTLARRIAPFDTVVLFGNNLGIFGTPGRATALLTEWAERTGPAARILVESTTPYYGGAPAIDRAYYRRNRQRGDLGGQCQLRLWYANRSSAWFPWLFVSRAELRGLLAGTGWRVARILGAGPGDPYVAVVEKG